MSDFYITPSGIMRRLDPAPGPTPSYWYIGPEQKFRVFRDTQVKKVRPPAWTVIKSKAQHHAQ